MKLVMNVLHRLFPLGHFVISLLFLGAGIALIGIAGTQLWQGSQLFKEMGITERLNFVLESIAVLTVAVAALELGQTILEEEVQRAAHMSAPTRVRRFLSRFMIVLVVALSIETVVLMFRVSQEAPEQLPYVASVGFAAAALLAAWGLFIWLNRSAEELEPEAMAAAKREDQKVEKSVKGGT
jgi:NADH:ubiquinone oxidoreductase subunit 5 (subunit L)/multisubunit Na+/H+ antiporter MnhA subunit